MTNEVNALLAELNRYLNNQICWSAVSHESDGELIVYNDEEVPVVKIAIRPIIQVSKARLFSVGNGEKCPWCDEIMTDFKIGGVDSMTHYGTKHRKEVEAILFG